MRTPLPISRLIEFRRQFEQFARRAQANDSRVLSGYVSSVDDNDICLIHDLDSNEELQIPRTIIDSAWQPTNERNPTLIVVSTLRGIRRNGTEVTHDSASGDYSAADDLLFMAVGGGKSCAEKRADCDAGCEKKHPKSKDGDVETPLNRDLRESCIESCGIGENVCKGKLGAGLTADGGEFFG